MLPQCQDGMANEVAAESRYTGEDSISAPPDALLHDVLSFLPADEAVRTCALARRWRAYGSRRPSCA
ncbi:hypothetical protein SEVIR_8G069350v4 [Setaria viridis]